MIMPLWTRRQTLTLTLASVLPWPRLANASDLAKVSIALDWTPNTNHIGLFVAQAKGFYSDAGLDVQILPYTDTDASTLVANGVADFGITSTVGLFMQRAGGAPVKGVYAVVQTETGRFIFNDSRKDIQRPRDLDGKTYGGFGASWENALITAVIKNDGGQGEFETVTLGTSAYEALASGSVDFTMEVYTWEGIEAALEKKALRRFRYSDYGVPDEPTTIIVSNDSYIDRSSASGKAFVQATKRGYDYSVDHPDEAARLLISGSGGALTNEALVNASLKELIDGHYLKTSAGTSGTIDPSKAQAIGEFLFENGILVDAQGTGLKEKPDFAEYFTNALFG
jgi:ABC-type nitrate/sulfonate/bicarbonate transport system substrate-binding protein